MSKTDLGKVWDQMAKDDFFYRFPRSGDQEEIGRWLDEARQMVEAFTTGFFTEQSFRPQDKTALEIGCGAGRQTYWLAKMFANVHAIDVSEEMLKNAKHFNAAVGNIVWSKVNGTDLAPLADDYLDFVYSFAVFKHITSKAIVRQLLREVARVLKPGGIFKIDIACHPTGTRKVLGVPLVPRGLIHGLPHPLRFAVFALLGFSRRQRFRALSAHPATLGVRFSPRELPDLFASAGLALHGVEQIKLPMSMHQGGAFFATSHELDEHFSNRFWCTGKRP